MAPQDPLRIQGGRSGIPRDPWGPEHLDPAFHIGRRLSQAYRDGVKTPPRVPARGHVFSETPRGRGA